MEEKNDFVAENIGIQIKRIRKIKSMTQEKLAEYSDCSINFIGEVERGETSPSFHYFIKICVGLQVDPNTLFKSINDQVYEKIEKEVKATYPK